MFGHCEQYITVGFPFSQISHTDRQQSLPPSGSEERGVFGVGSIRVTILPSGQNMKTIAIQYEYSLVLNRLNVFT